MIGKRDLYHVTAHDRGITGNSPFFDGIFEPVPGPDVKFPTMPGAAYDFAFEWPFAKGTTGMWACVFQCKDLPIDIKQCDGLPAFKLDA